MNKIPVAGPSITTREAEYAADAAQNAWYSRAGEYSRRFEKAFAEYIGVRYVVCLPSCTSALHLALASLGIGPGDEVIVPELTWIATSAPISYVGATPVFADVDPVTWCLDADSLAKTITNRTKAAIAVDLYGGMPDYDALRRIAHNAGIALIEDAAEAFGSMYKTSMAGSLGLAAAFSFHGSKTLTTGEGGMLVTDSQELHSRALILRDHGRTPGDVSFRNQEVGFKYKMSDLQAAVGLAQAERAEELVEGKRKIFSWYREELEDVPGLTLNAEPPGIRNSYWMTTVLFDPGLGLDKATTGEFFKAKGIDTRPFFYPLSSLPAYRDLPQSHEAQSRNHISYSISSRGLNLPSALALSREDVACVAQTIRELIAMKK